MAEESSLEDTSLAERRQPVSILAEGRPLGNSLIGYGWAKRKLAECSPAENRVAEHMAAVSRLVDTSQAERRHAGRK